MNTTYKAGAEALIESCRLTTGTAKHDEALTLRTVARAKAGDRGAVQYLYNRYAPTVRRYAAGVMRDADAAEDVVQTTFLKLLTQIDRYEPRDVPFEAWLLRVARNVAFDELRRSRARSGPDVLEHDGATTDPGPDRYARLRRALANVPPAEREVLVLRYLVGLSAGEVAGRLGIAEATVRLLHRRGRAQLRTALDRPLDKHAHRAGDGGQTYQLRRARSRTPLVEALT